MAVETPAFEILKQDGPFELRRYEGYITASVLVTASSYGEAANAGFRPLADYIFGDNHESGRIAMTSPVSVGSPAGRRIAMTAPVASTHSGDDYVVSFTMPSEYAMKDLPQPNDPRVVLESVSSYVVAAVRFSGHLSDRSAVQATDTLRSWMEEQGLTPVGEPIAAQYDAPWKPGFARHNEIMIPVGGGQAGPIE